MPGKHSILSPSSASRWLVCTPSARLEAKAGDKSSVFADEGTLAHKLGELLILYRLHRIITKRYKAALADIVASEHYSAEMWDHCNDYADFVLERYNAAKAVDRCALLLTESKVNLRTWIPDAEGTTDNTIGTTGYIEVIDLKYGKGVPVDALENKQAMLYGLGALRVFDLLFDVNTVKLTIYQPRIDNISTWEISVDDLLDFGSTIVRPIAKIAYAGEGDFNPGKHCQFCKVKATCRANSVYRRSLARYDFKEPALLDDYEVSEVLRQVDSLVGWANAVKQYAFDKAMRGGVFEGFKLVSGRAVRKYKNEKAIVRVLKAAGLTDAEIFSKKLLGITEMTKLLGIEDFNRLIGDQLVRPAGKPALVPLEDSRPVFKSKPSAKDDFAALLDLTV